MPEPIYNIPSVIKVRDFLGSKVDIIELGEGQIEILRRGYISLREEEPSWPPNCNNGFYDAAVLHDVVEIDRAPTIQLLLCDAFTTRSHGLDPTTQRVAAIGVPRYSCSHSLKRVERNRGSYFSMRFCNLSNRQG